MFLGFWVQCLRLRCCKRTMNSRNIVKSDLLRNQRYTSRGESGNWLGKGQIQGSCWGFNQQVGVTEWCETQGPPLWSSPNAMVPERRLPRCGKAYAYTIYLPLPLDPLLCPFHLIFLPFHV
jgi:hypothetical protein